jgi:hypothetical protein
MTSAPVRDPLAEHLLTPENGALLLTDYQPAQLAGARSMDRMLLVKNAVSTVKTIKTFEPQRRATGSRRAAPCSRSPGRPDRGTAPRR